MDTGKVLVFRDDQDRKAMISHRGANVSLTPDDIDFDLIKRCEALFISGYALLHPPQCQAALSAAKASRDAGNFVAFDIVPHRVFSKPLGPEYTECLSLANAIFLEAGTARRMLRHDWTDTDAIVKELLRMHDLVVLRVSNDMEIVATRTATAIFDTGYSSADLKLGYLDRLAAARLYTYLRSKS
jgi:sugar/nucleoside kinase (ribokinase family)